MDRKIRKYGAVYTAGYRKDWGDNENDEQAVRCGHHPVRVDAAWKLPASAHTCACLRVSPALKMNASLVRTST